MPEFFLAFYIVPSTLAFAAGAFVGLRTEWPISLMVGAATLYYVGHSAWHGWGSASNIVDFSLMHPGALACAAGTLGICLGAAVRRVRGPGKDASLAVVRGVPGSGP